MRHAPVTKVKLEEAVRRSGLSKTELASRAGLSKTRLYSILSPTETRSIHEQTAALLAAALGIPVENIDWPKPLSTSGKPPGKNMNDFRRQASTAACPVCFVELPATGKCDEHG